jgi:hypothetical protein
VLEAGDHQLEGLLDGQGVDQRRALLVVDQGVLDGSVLRLATDRLRPLLDLGLGRRSSSTAACAAVPTIRLTPGGTTSPSM